MRSDGFTLCGVQDLMSSKSRDGKGHETLIFRLAIHEVLNFQFSGRPVSFGLQALIRQGLCVSMAFLRTSRLAVSFLYHMQACAMATWRP